MKRITLILSACLILHFMTRLMISGQTMNEDKPAIKLMGLQMPVGSDISKNRDIILQGIKEAAGNGASFLVTPEGSLSGYTSNFDQNELSEALKELITTAQYMKVGLMLGTCFKEVKNGKEVCYNQVRVYTPEGKDLGAYSKILRCSDPAIPGTGEMTEYAEGTLRTFEWKDYTFGILICNDLWATPGFTTIPNPYLPWKLRQMGAQFIIHCINSGSAQKYRPFHESSAELWALSLKIPILEVNAAQDEKINAQSGLIGSDGERINRVPDMGTRFFPVGLIPSDATQ